MALYNYSADVTSIVVYGIGDFHIGSPECNMGLVEQTIQRVLDTENTFAILLGDLIDNALVNSKSDVYTATMQPGKQIKKVAEIISPLIQNRRVLAVLDGNHEARTARSCGISPSSVLCDILGVSKLYTPTTALIRIKMFETMWTIYAAHGSGGGSTIGAKANALERRGRIAEVADVIMAGHTHVPMAFKEGIIRIDKDGNEFIANRLFLNCGSCLGYRGSYGDTAGFVPSVYGYPGVVLYSDGRDPRAVF